MTTATNSLILGSSTQQVVRWTNRALEACWLLTAFLVPLAFFDRDFASSEAVIGYVEVPKIALLRTLAGIMVILWMIEWGVQGKLPVLSRTSPEGVLLQPKQWLPKLRGWLAGAPTRWVVLAAWFFLGTTLLSTLLSGAPSVSWWGEVPGQDGYPAYTVAAYLIVFGVIATHLKTREQLVRILGAVILSGVLVAGYGILQHYDHDFLDLAEKTGGARSNRVTAFMGNAIFAAAFMLMSIPVTLVAAVASLPKPGQAVSLLGKNLGRWMPTAAILAVWGIILAIEVLGLTFTFSRGPWMGTGFAVAVAVGLIIVFMGLRSFGYAIIVLGIAFGIALAILDWQGSISIPVIGKPVSVLVIAAALAGSTLLVQFWGLFGRIAVVAGVIAVVLLAVLLAPRLTGGPDSGSQASGGPVASPSTSDDVAERLTTIPTEVLGGILSGRITHWEISWKLVKSHPWFEFDSLALPWLRPVVGYGPDLFRYTYLLESPPEGANLFPLEPDHAHNYFIHQAVEQGVLGLLSSLGLFVAVFVVGGYRLLRERRHYSNLLLLVLIGLLAVVAGRFLEMMVGVARVSDLTMLWVLLGVFVALPAVLGSAGAAPESSPAPARPPREVSRRARRQASRSQAAGNFDGRLMIRLAIVAILIGAAVSVTWLKSVNYARAAIQTGSALEDFYDGDLQSSLEGLEQAIDLAPDVSTYHNYRANIYLAFLFNTRTHRERGCELQTEIQYENCLGLQSLLNNLSGDDARPFYFRSKLALGNSAFNLRQDQEAIDAYRDSLALVPASWAIRDELADAYLVAGQPENALPILEESLAITGGGNLSGRAIYMTGVARAATNDLEIATALLQDSLTMGLGTRDTIEAYETLDEIDAALGRARSTGDYDLATNRNPMDGLAILRRGLLRVKLGQLDDAIIDFNHGIRRELLAHQAEAQLGNIFASVESQQSVEKGISLLNNVIAREPDNPLYLSWRAKGFQSTGQNGLAIQELDQALALDPNISEAHITYAKALLALGRTDEALVQFQEALTLDPQSIDAYQSRADLYDALGEYQLADADVNRAQSLSELKARGSLGRSLASVDFLESTRTVEDLTNLIELRPDSVEAYRGRAKAFTLSGEDEKAHRDIMAMVDLGAIHIDLVDSIAGIAEAYFNAGQPAESVRVLDGILAFQASVLDQDPLLAVRVEFLKGLAHWELQQHELASQFLEESLGPELPRVLNAQAYRILDQADDALGRERTPAFYDQVASRDPTDGLAVLRRGLLYLKLGQITQAVADFDTGIRRDLLVHESKAQLGNVYSQTTSKEPLSRAISYLEGVIDREPGNALYRSWLARAYQRSGQNERAIEELELVLALDPDIGDAHNTYGTALLAFGRVDEARSRFDEAILRDPRLIASYFERGARYASVYKNDIATIDAAQKGLLSEADIRLLVTQRQAAFNLGNSSETTELLTSLIAADSDDVEAYLARALATTVQGDDTRARRDFEKAISLGADRYRVVDSTLGVVGALLESGQTVDATRVIDGLLANEASTLMKHPSLAIKVHFAQGLAQRDLDQFFAIAGEYLNGRLAGNLPDDLGQQVRTIAVQVRESSTTQISIDDYRASILANDGGPVTTLRRKLLVSKLTDLDSTTSRPDPNLDDIYPFPASNS